MTTSGAVAPVEHTPCGALHVLDTSDVRGGFVLDCDSGVQIRLSRLAYRVLAAAWLGTSFDDIAIQCSDRERRLTALDVGRVYDRVVERVAAAEQHRRTRGLEQGFLLRLTLLPAALIWRLATPCAALFGPFVAVPATVLIACAAAYWTTTQHVAPPMSGYELLTGYALFALTCVAHELGHAGACLRFGVRPGPVGLALYLVFPVLYSDVTRIWRLSRWRRVAVDVGGSYIQCLCGTCYVLIFMHTHDPALFFAISLIIAATLLNMNPIFRFDGYWIVSDSLGVSGLMTHVGLFFRRVLARFTGRGDVSVPPWPGHIVAAVTLYSVVALAGWVWFVAQLIATALAQGRWLLTAVPALTTPGAALSIATAGELGAAMIVALGLAFCFWKLLHFVRGLMTNRNDRGPRA